MQSLAVALGQKVLGYFLSLAILVPWFLWSSLGVWLCAFNTEKKLWGFVARFYVVAQAYIATQALLVFF